jgi:hypothetical protein
MASIHKNVALRKKVLASSSLTTSTTGALAVDGTAATSWISNAGLTQWLQIDLGQRFTVSRVKLNWNAAYAVRYQIQISMDARTWTNLYNTTGGNGTVDDLVGLNGSGRYIRIVANQFAPQSTGYSLREFEVYP